MKQIITRLALLIAMLYASSTAYAYDCIIDNICYNLDNTTKTATVTYKDTDMTLNGMFYKQSMYSIPKMIKYNDVEYSVTAIGAKAFYNGTKITDVLIADGITSIGNYAFYGCSGITAINFRQI